MCNIPLQVTQSTVDKYVDDILLQTIYSSAHEDTLAEMGLDPEQVQEDSKEARRASTGECSTAGEGGVKEPRSKEAKMVRQRMKATQKKYLAAAHDQIWGMLDQFKHKAGEVRSMV